MKSLALSPSQFPLRGVSVTLPGRGLDEKLRQLEEPTAATLPTLPSGSRGSIPEDQSLV